MSSLVTSPVFFEIWFLTDLEAHELGRLVGQRPPRTSAETKGALSFYVGAGGHTHDLRLSW